MNVRLPISLVALLFMIPMAAAYSIDSYGLAFDMQENTVTVEASIAFNESVSDNLEFVLPPESTIIGIQMDNETINPDDTGNILSLNLSSTNALSLSYETSFYIDKHDFLFDFTAPFEIKQLSIVLKLPPRAYLEQSLENGGSIYPKPDQALTDGERLIFAWNITDMNEGDEFTVYAKTADQRDLTITWIISAILAGVIIFLLAKSLTHQKPLIENHLKEDEETIINVLKQRDDQKIEQGTLRIITGFPKSTLSRLLTELEERKLIYKEKKGKKNLVFMRY